MRIVAIPSIERGRIVRSEEAIVAGSVTGLCAYAVALISEGRYRVWRCQLERCERFFIPRPSHGRYDEYCCQKHQDIKHGK